MRLATLEGNSIRSPRRRRTSVHAEAMNAFSGYGCEPDTLGGIMSFAKRTARKTGNVVSQSVRATVPVLRKVGSVQNAILRPIAKADVPLISQAAQLQLSASKSYEKAVRNVNNAVSGKTETEPETAFYSSPKVRTGLIIVALGLGGWLFLRKAR